MHRILAASDLSPRGDHAVARGAELARRFGAELVLLHVVDDELPKAARQSQIGEAKDVLQAQAEPEPNARVRIETGLDFQVIAQVAAAEAADLVVVGPHRRSLLRDLFIGTTVERLVRAAAFPVMVARNAAAAPYGRVIAAVDLVEEARDVLRLAAKLATSKPLQLVHVLIDPVAVQLSTFGVSPEAKSHHQKDVELKAKEILGRLARECGVEGVVPQVLHGGPVVTQLAAAAKELKADLVVMGTSAQSRSALERWLLASQAEQALIEADIDVLCLPLGTTTRIADAPRVP
ncbi:MAG: universal stress protein [Geminicoccaceae bacterium]|nr:MAG: universal stress protein [Geminicoccaceae bacterium]